MSCGGLHGDGDHGFHIHAPDDPEYMGAPGNDTPGQDDSHAEPEAPREPGKAAVWARGMWQKNKYQIKPFAFWVPGIDAAACTAHLMTAGDPFAGVMLALGGGVAAEAATEIRNKKRGRSQAWKAMTRKQVAVATAWSMAASGWTMGGVPVSGVGLMQWAALLGGGTLAGRYVYEVRKARKPPKGKPALPELDAAPEEVTVPAGPDPRMTAFTDRFCMPDRELPGVSADRFRELASGFMFELEFPDKPSEGPYARHLQMSDVEALRIPVAHLYNVTRNDVTVSYVPGNETERRCQVIIATREAAASAAEQRANPQYNRWDGNSTWDPETGLMDLGLFIDGKTTHYRANTPGSGAAMGMAAGVAGSGKSGTISVITADLGQARMCPGCIKRADRCECGRADPQRVWAVWVGDAQAHGMGVWRGRADMTGWGPEGLVELLEFCEEVADARSEARSGMEWTDYGPDGQVRHNTGKSWFDPEPGWPGILVPLDEWQRIVGLRHDEDLVKQALRIIARAITEWRKVGMHPLVGVPTLDLSMIGVREIRELIKYINSISHRTDAVSTTSGGIGGDPMLLPANDPGVGYINGPDGRSGTGDRFHTKFCPESLKPGMTGVDIRHIAGIIERTPVQYDPGTLKVMDRWGLSPSVRQVFTEWKGRPQYGDAAPGSTVPETAPSGPGVGGMPFREDAEKVLAALREAGTPGARIPDLMRATDLGLDAVARSLDALTANGHAVKAGTDQYAAA